MTLLHPDLEKEVLKKINPTKEEYEKRDKIFNKVKSVVERRLREASLEGEVTLQGSARKGTWLRGSLELDVFVLFPPQDKKWIREAAFPVLLSSAKELGEPEVRYAEHPYVRVEVEGVPVELVPAFKVKSASKAITAVDRTPFHTRWFLEQVKKLGEGIVEEVRLLKAFFKGIKVYGAEIKVRGFSGFMTEILVTYYGGFAEVLKAATAWRPPVVLETSLSKKEALKRFKSPMIAPDPTDPRRNAAAAVSLDSLATFVLAATVYQSKPSLSFYFEPAPPRSVPALPTYVVEIPLKGGFPPETVWGELQRITDSVLKRLERAGFVVTRRALWSDERSVAKVALEFLQDVLPPMEVKSGPPVWLKNNVERFLKKHENAASVWVDGGRLYAVEERKVRTAPEGISEALKDLKAESLDIEKYRITKVVDSPQEGWLAWFVRGRPSWWP